MLEKIYNKADMLAAAGSYVDAYEAYYALASYSDSTYKAAEALYHIWETDASYGTLSQRDAAMTALRQHVGDGRAEIMLNSAGFNPVRLLGNWSDGDSFIALKRDADSPDQIHLTMDVSSINDTRIQMDVQNIGFDGNIIYRLTDASDPSTRRVVFQITSFDSLTAAAPDMVSIYCFLNNREYVLDRQ